jgi:hypothetical protein
MGPDAGQPLHLLDGQGMQGMEGADPPRGSAPLRHTRSHEAAQHADRETRCAGTTTAGQLVANELPMIDDDLSLRSGHQRKSLPGARSC